MLAGFLDHLQRGGHAGYYWTVAGDTKRSYWWDDTGRPEPPTLRANLYFGVNPTDAIPTTNRDGQPRQPQYLRSRIDLVAAVNCLFSEFDAKDYGHDLDRTLAVVETLTPRPSVVVASGGGYHCYWLLDEPWLLTDEAERQRARDMLSAWVDYTGGDDSSKDLARVLRVPGSLNLKYTPPRPVEFLWCELERLYQRDELFSYAERAWARGKLDLAVEKVQSAPDGHKHTTLLKVSTLAGGLVHILDEQVVERELYDAIAPRAADPKNAEKTIRDGISYGRAMPLRLGDGSHRTEAPTTDLDREFVLRCLTEDEAGDAQLVEALYGELLCYDHAGDRWYAFTDHAWHPFDGLPRKLVWGSVAAVYLAIAAQVQAEAARLPESDVKRAEASKTVDALMQRARKLRTLGRIDNVLTLAQELLGIKGNEWDADPWLLGVPNGVVDLRTGDLRDGRPEDYIRTVAPTLWAGLDAPAPRWERFVSEVLSDEPDRVAFLQRLLGYALNGTTQEHVLAVCVGERGRNGKRVLFEALQHVLGDYTKSVSTDVLIGQERLRGAGSAQPHLMELQGRRIAYCSETGEQDQLSAAQVKNITGGDPITARWLHANPITFNPTHTLFLQTNRKPQAPADDDALWSRVVALEFKVRFVDDPQAADERPRDPQLEDTLRAEAPGILAWLVRGGLAWLQGGLQTPASVKLAREKYRQEESIEPFIETACIQASALQAEGGELYDAYKRWAEANGLRVKTPTWFGRQMSARYQKGRTASGRACYYGIGLVTTEFVPPQPENPSGGITTRNNAVGMPAAYTVFEGLQPISKSSEEKSLANPEKCATPSDPSDPSVGLPPDRVVDPDGWLDGSDPDTELTPLGTEGEELFTDTLDTQLEADPFALVEWDKVRAWLQDGRGDKLSVHCIPVWGVPVDDVQAEARRRWPELQKVTT